MLHLFVLAILSLSYHVFFDVNILSEYLSLYEHNNHAKRMRFQNQVKFQNET